MSTQQNARTPRNFLRAVENKFKVKFIFDLACTYNDCVVDKNSYPYPHGFFFDQGTNALELNWGECLPEGRVLPDGTEEAGWINPPWKSIWEWSEKASEYIKGSFHNEFHGPDDNYAAVFEPPPLRLFSLFPHGTSSQWRACHVQGKVDIYNLAPRVPYINPETGDFYRDDKTGKPKCSQTDAILVDWAGAGQTLSWNWLDDVPKES